MLALTACNPQSPDHGFRIEKIELRPQARRLQVDFDQELRFSRESVNALEHGVPLVLSVNMELRDSETLALLATERQTFEIRYLPLSQRYELNQPDHGSTRTYPRLRHVVNALSGLSLDFDTGPLAPGDYEFRARVRLEQSSLPAPMQLPVLVSGEWRHDSNWSSWPFKISA